MSSLNIILKDADFSKIAVKQVETDIDIPITAITLDGNPTTVNSQSNTANFSALFVPASTTQKKTDWTLKGGTNTGTAGDGTSTVNGVASIARGTGLLTIMNGADSSKVTVVCTSVDNPSVKAEWDVTVTYHYKDMALSYLGENIADERNMNFSVAPGKSVSFTVTGGGYINNGSAQVKTITVTNTDGSNHAYNGTYKAKLNKGDILVISNPQNLSAVGALSYSWDGSERLISNTDLYFEDSKDIYMLSEVTAFSGILFKSDVVISNNVFNNIKMLINWSDNKIKAAKLGDRGGVLGRGADIKVLEVASGAELLVQDCIIGGYTLAPGITVNISYFTDIQSSDSVVQKIFADGNYKLTLINNQITFINSTFNATTIALLKKVKATKDGLVVNVNGKDVDTL